MIVYVYVYHVIEAVFEGKSTPSDIDSLHVFAVLLGWGTLGDEYRSYIKLDPKKDLSRPEDGRFDLTERR